MTDRAGESIANFLWSDSHQLKLCRNDAYPNPDILLAEEAQPDSEESFQNIET